MIVSVYRNLKHGYAAVPLYSIVHKGRVIARRHKVLLSDVTFVVRPGGRARVLRTGKKNVHAFAKGTLVGSRGIFGIDCNTKKPLPVRIKYNPYAAGSFLDQAGLAVKSARGVLLNERGISGCYLEHHA